MKAAKERAANAAAAHTDLPSDTSADMKSFCTTQLGEPNERAASIKIVETPDEPWKSSVLACEKRLFLNFSYVCPEPVLVKIVLYKMAQKRAFSAP